MGINERIGLHGRAFEVQSEPSFYQELNSQQSQHDVSHDELFEVKQIPPLSSSSSEDDLEQLDISPPLNPLKW